MLFFCSLFVAVLVDNFQLTLADAEVRKKRDEQLFLEEQQKFDEIDDIDATDPGIIINNMTLDIYMTLGLIFYTLGIKKSSLTDEMDNELELGVDDYFPVQKDSKYDLKRHMTLSYIPLILPLEKAKSYPTFLKT